MSDITLTIRLAKTFSVKLGEYLTRAQFREMIDLNKGEPENSGICHSHDHCDANVFMLEAFSEVLGYEPAADSDFDTDLWNDAWSVAKAADFFA